MPDDFPHRTYLPKENIFVLMQSDLPNKTSAEKEYIILILCT